RILARVPWEPVVLVLAAAGLYEIRTRPLTPAAGPDLLLLVFPILFVAGLSGLVARALPRLLGALRGRIPAKRMPAFLAVRRLASAPRMAVLLVTGTSIAVGVLVYAGALAGSVDRTAEAKAVASAGSDLAVPLAAEPSGRSVGEAPPGAVAPSTLVLRLGAGRLAPGGQVDVIAVDPATFEQGARWDGSFSERSLGALLDDLVPAGGGDRIPAIVAGDGAAVPRTGGLMVQGTPVAVTVVDRVHAFPGMRTAGRPLVVVDRGAIIDAVPELAGLRSAVEELWERGDAATLRSRLEAAGVDTTDAVTFQGVRQRPDLLALTWTIQLLLALGVTAGLVAVAALFLYMQARQAQRDLAFALGRKMGLSDRAHRRALTLELGLMLGVAAASGAVLALAAAALVRARVRVLPEAPGPTVAAAPWTMLVAVALGTVVVAMVGGRLAQRRARRTNVSEVLRLAA
ncbi:MAG TPA: FtsX-like permease family protein, partial [Mycobacteriales bacterium]|nr:FtsX-like permease family protein [Mycobacteriales bacterium]